MVRACSLSSCCFLRQETWTHCRVIIKFLNRWLGSASRRLYDLADILKSSFFLKSWQLRHQSSQFFSGLPALNDNPADCLSSPRFILNGTSNHNAGG